MTTRYILTAYGKLKPPATTGKARVNPGKFFFILLFIFNGKKNYREPCPPPAGFRGCLSG